MLVNFDVEEKWECLHFSNRNSAEKYYILVVYFLVRELDKTASPLFLYLLSVVEYLESGEKIRGRYIKSKIWRGRRSWNSVAKWVGKQLVSGASVFIFLVGLLTLKCSTYSSSPYLLIINPHFKADQFSRLFLGLTQENEYSLLQEYV